jgi:hypothetical protein
MATAIGLEDTGLLHDGFMERAPLVAPVHLQSPETTVGQAIIPFGGHLATKCESGFGQVQLVASRPVT